MVISTTELAGTKRSGLGIHGCWQRPAKVACVQTYIHLFATPVCPIPEYATGTSTGTSSSWFRGQTIYTAFVHLEAKTGSTGRAAGVRDIPEWALPLPRDLAALSAAREGRSPSLCRKFDVAICDIKDRCMKQVSDGTPTAAKLGLFSLGYKDSFGA
jgi:hypothetical protein